VKEVNEYNGLELAIDFNNIEEGNFHDIYTYPKELYTKDLSIGMKTILEDNDIHPHPFKFVCGMQQCSSQFANKEEHIEHIEKFHHKNIFSPQLRRIPNLTSFL
jgi:hypothetical protein